MLAIQAEEKPSSTAISSSSRSRLSACGVCDSVRDIPIRIWISVPPMFTMTAMPGYWISIG